MARDRKRAKQRRDRARRTSGVTATPRPRPARADDPLEHQSAEADLAEAQLALGRSGEEEDDGALVAAEAEHDGEAYARDADGVEIAPDELEEASDRVTTPGSRESRGEGVAARERQALPANRVIGFLQASWRELQRVQWPDRRQVTQATGVVLAFVIIAGLYLGLADEVFSKLVDAIL